MLLQAMQSSQTPRVPGETGTNVVDQGIMRYVVYNMPFALFTNGLLAFLNIICSDTELFPRISEEPRLSVHIAL